MGSACSSNQAVAASGNEGGGGKEPQPQPPKEESDPAQTASEGPKNGEIPAGPQPTAGVQQTDEQAAVADDDVDSELKNIDGGPPQYKLVYFAGLRFRAEPIRLILRYANVPYEEELVSFEDWQEMKSNTPMGVLPIMHIGDRILCQANAIARFLAKKYGLYGRTNLEAAKVDMFVDALTDVMNELGLLVMEQNPGKRSDIWHQVKDEVICPFLDRCIKLLAESNSGWFVGDEATWADLAIAELLMNLYEKVDSTLLDTYPALQAHINGVRALPHIMEYISERPDAML